MRNKLMLLVLIGYALAAQAAFGDVAAQAAFGDEAAQTQDNELTSAVLKFA